MSYKMTLNIVEKISENYDSKVKSWAAELKRQYLLPHSEVKLKSYCPFVLSLVVLQQMSHMSNKQPKQSVRLSLIDSSGEESECNAPSFSPISSKESVISSSSNECILSDTGSMEKQNKEEEYLEECDLTCEQFQMPTEELDAVSETDICVGYRFIGDNVDKNVKPTYQRHEHRTQSLHHFHSYAVKDRSNSTLLSDVPPNFIIPDPQMFLPSQEDVDSIKEELSILLKRYIKLYLLNSNLI